MQSVATEPSFYLEPIPGDLNPSRQEFIDGMLRCKGQARAIEQAGGRFLLISNLTPNSQKFHISVQGKVSKKCARAQSKLEKHLFAEFGLDLP